MKKTIQLLWTGGFDSTFRLLQLLIENRYYIRPIYVIDDNRRSTLQEIKTIKKLLELIKEMYPAQYDNLLPIEILLKPGQKLCEQSIYFTYFTEFQKLGRIGHQYLWLPIIADLNSLTELELSTEKLDSATVEDTWAEIVYPLLHGTGHERRVATYSTNDEKFKLFAHFRFPISDITKDDMYMIAENLGFQDILNHTWHCHYPIFNRPCGLCRPCIIGKRHRDHSVHRPINILLAKTYNFIVSKLKKLLVS